MDAAYKKGAGVGSSASAEEVIALYIADLQARFGAYERPIEEVRDIVDAAMGETRLTDLLYKMRREDDVM